MDDRFAVATGITALVMPADREQIEEVGPFLWSGRGGKRPLQLIFENQGHNGPVIPTHIGGETGMQLTPHLVVTT